MNERDEWGKEERRQDALNDAGFLPTLQPHLGHQLVLVDFSFHSSKQFHVYQFSFAIKNQVSFLGHNLGFHPISFLKKILSLL